MEELHQEKETKINELVTNNQSHVSQIQVLQSKIEELNQEK